jgi:hypothetical protein
LDNEVKTKLPKVVPTRWNSTSQIVQAVHEYRDTPVNFFQNTVDNPDDWDTETYLTSHGFLASFQDFDFIFLLSALNELFSISDTLLEILQKKAMDINYCLRKVIEFKDVINNKRTDFYKFWAHQRASQTSTKKETKKQFLREEK